MADYKVIFRNDNQGNGAGIPWEPGCPLLVNAVQVSRNTETGACYLQLKLSNLTGETIGRFTLTANVSYADGTTETVELAPLDADIAPGRAYKPDPIPLAGSDVGSVGIRIAEATYGTARWESAGEAAPIPQGEPVTLETFANIERSRTLIELGKSTETHNAALVEGATWWVCSCGMPNVARDTCCACGLSKETLKNLEDETWLREKAEERKTTERAKQKRKTRKIIALSCAGIAVIALLVSGVFFFPQYALYQQAAQLQDSGSFKTAYEQFTELGGFLDSDDRARECAKLAADRSARAGDNVDAELWYEKAGESDLQQQTADERKQAEVDRSALLQEVSQDPILGRMVNNSLQAAAFTDTGSFDPENLTNKISLNIRLDDSMNCEVTYADSKFHSYSGTWSRNGDELFTVALPDEIGGTWTAVRTNIANEFLLKNNSNKSLQFFFVVDDEHITEYE